MKLTDWAAIISAFAAVIGVIMALITNAKNLKQVHASNSAKMVFDLVATFNSAEMKKNRGNFANAIKNKKSSIDVTKDCPVLEFFEEVAYMTRREILDEGMVWNSFSWWFEPYYMAVRKVGKDIIKEARDKSNMPSLFCEIDWLYYRMLESTRKKDKYSFGISDLDPFLDREIELLELMKCNKNGD